MCQGLGPKKHDEISETDRILCYLLFTMYYLLFTIHDLLFTTHDVLFTMYYLYTITYYTIPYHNTTTRYYAYLYMYSCWCSSIRSLILNKDVNKDFRSFIRVSSIRRISHV